MKRLTKQIKNRIYTIIVDIASNTIAIHRGRGGLEDSQPIFDESGHFEYASKKGNLQMHLEGNMVRDEIYMTNIPIDEAEGVIANAVLDRVHQLEAKLQKE